MNDSYKFSEKYCLLLMKIINKIDKGKKYKKLRFENNICFQFSNFTHDVNFKIILTHGYLQNQKLHLPIHNCRGICFSDKIIIPIFYNNSVYDKDEISNVLIHELTHVHQRITNRLTHQDYNSYEEWSQLPSEIEANQNMELWKSKKKIS